MRPACQSWTATGTVALHSDNHRVATEYLGRYLKHPPLGETRILASNNVNAHDGKGKTALIMAAERGHAGAKE